MDLQIVFYKAVCYQIIAAFKIPVFRGLSKYQYGQGVSNGFCGILKFISTVALFLEQVAITGA